MKLDIESELRIAADDQSHCGNVAFEALTRLKRIRELASVIWSRYPMLNESKLPSDADWLESDERRRMAEILLQCGGGHVKAGGI